MSVLQGKFIGRVFSAWHNSYHVLKFDKGGDPVNVVFRDNNLPERGRDYTLQGSWSNSERYGWQFHCRILEPSEKYEKRHCANMSYLMDLIGT